MKNFFTKYVQTCPKTGKFIGFGKLKGFSRILFPLVGLAALIWVLIRVIPKPSRLTYPCVRTAIPIASGFIGYLAMLAISSVAVVRFKKSFRYYPVFFMAIFGVFSISGFYSAEEGRDPLIKNASVEANAPIGVAQGIFPGRVVWVHNPAATNENCIADSRTNPWYTVSNMDQHTVDGMLSASLQSLTGTTTDSDAWRAIFQYHNTKVGKGAVNYVAGEKIFIKTNATSAYQFNASDLSAQTTVSETSVGPVLAVLRQLVNVVGVSQSDIYVGDPMKHIYKHLYNAWHAEFPNVHYIDVDGYTNLGREKAVPSTTANIYFSDNGEVLRDNVWGGNWAGPEGTTPVVSNPLYKIFEDAEYLINIPMMKGHKRAGMTIFAKNHFGSQTGENASHNHMGLPAPREMENGVTNGGYGKYRVLVDIMSHPLLGKKNLVYIMDAMWSTDRELGTPLKWQLAPFNNDWTSSLFASFDPVAIESGAYDFLRSEYTVARGAGTYIQMDGVDDYLHQAADSANWPRGVRYDSDHSHSYFASLGVHEHWDNATDMKYSRNLGTGNGIELVSIQQDPNAIVNYDLAPSKSFELYQNYPNPFNPSTTITYALPFEASVGMSIYDMQGRLVRSFPAESRSAGYQSVVWNGRDQSGSPVASGMYIYKVTATSARQTFEKSAKMILLK